MRRIAVGLAVLLALLAVAAAGFDRDVLFDVRPAPYAASVRLFTEGARNLDIDLVEPDGAIPYLLPGPADPWAGSTEHTLRFRLGAVPRPVVLRLHAVETHDAAPPRLTIRLDGTVVGTVATRPGTGTPPPHKARGLRSRYTVRIPAGSAGPSVLTISNDQGSWIAWERIRLAEASPAFAWRHLTVAGVPRPWVTGPLVASIGAVLLGALGTRRRSRVLAAGSVPLLLMFLVYTVPEGFPPAALPRWSWLFAPWLALAAWAGVSAGAARARTLALAAGAFLLAFVGQAVFVKTFAVDIPFWDEWELLRLLVGYRAGTLTWAELFAQHNEHRIVVPRLLLLGGFDLLGEWSPRASMLVSALLVGAIAFVWAYTVRRLGAGTWLAWLSSAVLVSPLQWQNMTSGFQTAIYLAMLGTMVAIAAVALDDRLSWWTLVTAAVACSVATFSFAIGLATWIAVGLCLVVKISWPGRRGWTGWSKVAAFGLVAALNAAAFFYGYERPEATPIGFDFAALRWMLTALGFPLVEETRTSPVGLVAVALLQWLPLVLLALLYARRRHEDGVPGKLVILLGFGSFLLTAAVVVSLGRSFAPTIASRYGTFFLWTNLLSVMAVAELLGEARRLGSRARAAAIVGLWLLALGLLSPYVAYHRELVSRLQLNTWQRARSQQAMIRYVGDLSVDRRLGNPLAYPSREFLERVLSDPHQLPVVPLEIRLARSPGWRLTEDGPRVESPVMAVNRPTLVVPVTGYPSAPGNSLAIEAVANPSARILYEGPNPGADWAAWWVDASAFLGQEIRLAGAVANGAGHGWLEFKPPGQTGRLMGLLRDFPSTSVLGAGALVIGVLGLVSARGGNREGDGSAGQ